MNLPTDNVVYTNCMINVGIRYLFNLICFET